MTERTLPERLRAEAKARGGAIDEYNRQIFDEEITADMLAAADALDAKSALLAEAEKALEPFAKAITRAENDEPTSPANRLECARTDITLYEFARARTILAKLKTANAKPAPQPEGHGAG